MPALPGTSKRRNKRLPNPPTLISLPTPAREPGRSNEEPASSHSSRSSSDSHSSGSPGSKLSSGSLSPPHESSPESSRHASEVSFALPPPKRAIPLKRHSPLNPASFSNIPFPHPKPQMRPGINPLILESYRKSSTSATSSRSFGSRLYLNRSTTDENFFSPPASPYAPSSTLGGSILSLLPDGKNESVLLTKDGNLIPFPSDLYLVDNEPMNDEDMTYTSNEKLLQVGNYNVSVRGIGNIVTLVFLVTAIVALFIIYPIFSFYLYNDQNMAVSNNGNSTNLNARNQSPLSSYTIDLGNKHPSDFLKVGASEYKLTFADEWEMDGRRFSSGEDQDWISSINDDASTTRNGYLIFGQQAHLETRVPQCLPDGGFIDIGFLVEGIEERWHAYWSGNWSVIKANEDGDAHLTDVLQRSSVRGPVMVMLHMEFGGDVSSPVAVDYLRFYSLRAQYACGDDAPHVALYLNLSEHGANHSYSKSRLAK